MFQKIIALSISVLMVLSTQPLQASNDDTFISLTRRPSKRQSLPSNISVIRQEDIEKSGAQSITEILDKVGSIDLSPSGGIGTFTTVRMRGATTSAQVQVVVDDQPLGGISSQFLDLSQIPVNRIKRIEVVRGGSSILYGPNTIGGVIHVITKDGLDNPLTANASYEVRSHQTHIHQAQVGGHKGGFNSFFTASHLETDGFQHNSDINDRAASGRLGYSFGNGARITAAVDADRLKAGNSRGTGIDISQWDGEKERAPSDTTAFTEKDRAEGRVGISLPVGDNVVVKSNFFGSYFGVENFSSENTAPTFDQTTRMLGNDTRIFLPWGLTIGGSYGRDTQNTVGRADSHVTNMGVFVQERIQTGPVTFIPAVRLDNHSEFGNVVNPRFTVVYVVLPRWTISGNAARAFRSPSFLELFFKSNFFNGNPNLNPETAWTYDLGNQIQLGRNTELNVTGFFTRLRDQISATSTTFENLNKSEMSGVEVEINSKAGPVRKSVNYTYLRARGTAGGSTFVPLRLTPRHTVNAILIVDFLKGMSLFNSVTYVSDQFQFNNDTGLRLPPYAVWNARLEKTCSFVKLFFGVDNITDRRYAESFDNDPNTFASTRVPQPARTYRGGVEVRFKSGE